MWAIAICGGPFWCAKPYLFSLQNGQFMAVRTDYNYFMNSFERDELNKQGNALIGKRVDHPRFGSGKVIDFDSSSSPCITVQFEDKARLMAFDERTREMMNLVSEKEKRRKEQIIKASGNVYLSDWEDTEMTESLLAHLYSRIQGSQEDVATVSLNYIIDSSEALNAAFNKLLSDSLKIQLDSDIKYKDQSIGKNLERPDMSGADKDGKEVVLCEMKFYAGLTDNQPNGYLDRLIAEDGKALVFVCPKARQLSLWSKIKELCTDKGRSLSDEDGFRITVDGIAMAVITWTQIIECLRLTASSVAVTALPDIAQLSGFCNLMDHDAFIPFTSEELGPESARKEMRFYDVVDGVVDKLDTIKDLNPQKKGKQNAWRGGYWRNINIKNHKVEVSFHRDYWRDSLAEAPIWLIINDEEGHQPDHYKKCLNSRPDTEKHCAWDGRIMLALKVLPGVPKDDVVDDLVKQIVNKIDWFDGAVS